MSDIEHLRQNLKNSLLSAGVKQGHFAREVGMSDAAISNFLSGKNTPWGRNLIKIREGMVARGWLKSSPQEAKPDSPQGYPVGPATLSSEEFIFVLISLTQTMGKFPPFDVRNPEELRKLAAKIFPTANIPV
jgi:transcriptional regulator with XRE-family HTH domain